MGVEVAILGLAMGLNAAGEQERAGAKAEEAGEVGAASIEMETQMNIAQERKQQAQVMGTAKARIAASGVRFDAKKISQLQFTEGGEGVDESVDDAAIEAGRQTTGDTEGDSAFQYLREMKREFAKDIGWKGAEGRSRAKVARMGGQVAAAQSRAGAAQSYAGAVSSFGAAGESANWWQKGKKT